jgi:hypothetical protein
VLLTRRLLRIRRPLTGVLSLQEGSDDEHFGKAALAGCRE